MANFVKSAKALGLMDAGEATFGERKCQKCGTGLRLGEDKQGCTQSYCPKCLKKTVVLGPSLLQAVRRKK